MPSISDWSDLPGEPPRRFLGSAIVPRPLARGCNDLGDIALVAAPILASGRIERSDGGAVGELSVGIEREDEPGRWRHDPTVRVLLSGDGRFTTLGLHDHRRCRIDASKFGLTLAREPTGFRPARGTSRPSSIVVPRSRKASWSRDPIRGSGSITISSRRTARRRCTARHPDHRLNRDGSTRSGADCSLGSTAFRSGTVSAPRRSSASIGSRPCRTPWPSIPDCAISTCAGASSAAKSWSSAVTNSR